MSDQTLWIVGCYIVYAVYREVCVDGPCRRRQKEILAGQAACGSDVLEMKGRIVALEENPSSKPNRRR